ncbi:hypothetical protein Rhein_1693 [Rheinheimera sp. A13L]|uniref:hypothetical protein n=1 Tax=Rheinheimera sp. A13L TaxID=506534 RepID=UPI0002124886|nr:hypothetical protein [Rheinheimera sp. A13L]EGM78272.1 hypothetical protein Rhein_1693 [Rheinheimera sp. A13L]
MKWQKLGKIFDPTTVVLADGCTEFAKSPQALVFEDFVRIYFCAQKKTANGKYLSFPQYVDFDKSLNKILALSEQSIIQPGELGHFDEHGIFPFSVTRDDKSILAYTSGWSRRTSVSVDMSIGLARSTDQGASFEKYGAGGPVMAASHNEPMMVADAFVLKVNGSYHMWYIFGSHWQKKTADGAAERFYKIAYAHSSDGITWQRTGQTIIDERIPDECQALPTVIYAAGKYHMYFCYRSAYDFRQNSKNAYRLGYAWSEDLIRWTRDDNLAGIDLSDSGWDSEMMCYPNLFESDGQIFLLYNGNEFGRYGFGLARLTEL